MKDLVFYDKFILRTPQHPISKIDEFEKEYEALSIENEDSLFLASPSLLNQILDSKNRSEGDKLKLKLSYYQYWTRSHMRCTPYGLFANCQIGEWDQSTALEISGKEYVDRHTALDMNYLCVLGKHLESHEDIQEQLEFYPNTSIYFANNKYRFIYYTFDNKNNRTHRLNAVDENEYVTKILSKAKEGATLSALAYELIDEDIDLETALPYAKEFVQAQLLVSKFEVAIAGKEYLDQILEVLISLQQKTEYIISVIGILENLKLALKQLDKDKYNRKIQYEKVIEIIKQLELPYDISKLFQTVAFNNNTKIPKISYVVKKEILSCLNYLSKLYKTSTHSNLQEFARKFSERYGEQKIKLMDALDVESGIGYASNSNSGTDNPIVEGIPIYGKRNLSNTINQDETDAFLFKVLQKAKYENLIEVDLKQDEWKINISKEPHSLPPTVMFMGAYLGEDDGNKEHFHLYNVGGRSAINLLSRFAYGSQEIKNIIDDLVDHEKKINHEQAIAEIIHLPQARTGNILMHPTFLDYEICFLAKQSVTPKNTISLNDIEVMVNGSTGKICLWSERHNKNILPRLSNAHNYSNRSLPVYNFLGDFQYQDYSHGLRFDWKSLNNLYSYFPRIKYGRIVLSPQKWHIRPFVLKEMREAKKKNNKGYFIEINKIFDELKVPDQFLLSEGDNKILVERKKIISLDMFLKMIKNSLSVRIEEFLLLAFDGGVNNGSGDQFANEILGAIINKNGVSKNIFKQAPINIQDTFPPGSEWVYYKIYLGVKTSELVLVDYIHPLVQELMEKNIINSWFFIRYKDPNFHLRLRVKLSDVNKMGVVLEKFSNTLDPLVVKNIIHNIMLDTYKREVVRYGEETMELSEELFFHDSENIVSFLSSLDGDEDEEYRWKYAIYSIDSLLSSFQYDLDKKSQILEMMQVSFSREFGMEKYMKVSLDKRYRDRKEEIDAILSRKKIDDQRDKIYKHVEEKDAKIDIVCKELLKIIFKTNDKARLDDYLSSQIHMICNRLFLSNNRFHEFVIYYLMSKHYKSALGRLKYYKS